MAQRSRFQSNSGVLDTLPAPPSSVGYQVANAILFGVGIASTAIDGLGLPLWAMAGIHAAGAILVGTTAADLVRDYAGGWIADIIARLELRYNDHLQPREPEVRFIPLRHGAPSPGPLPAQPPAPTQTIDASDSYSRDDLLEFLQHGAVIGYTRRAWLPEGGERRRFQSGERISRKSYLRYVELLRRLGILTNDSQGATVLAVELHEAVRALGIGQPIPVGGQLTGAGTEGQVRPAGEGSNAETVPSRADGMPVIIHDARKP
jgi:hypothetical protein